MPSQSIASPQPPPAPPDERDTSNRPATVAGRAVHWLYRASPFAGLAVFGLALWVLHEALSTYRYDELVAAIAALPPGRLALALVVTVAGYAVLAGYDLLAFRFIGRSVRFTSIAAASFISSALGNNLGNTLLTGAAVRYWIYTSVGLPAALITRVVLFCSLAFWLGFLFLGATVFVLGPIGLPAALRLDGATTRPLGLVLGALLTGYLWLTFARRSLKLGRWQVELPSPAWTCAQIVVASLDLSLMALALYVLLPSAAGFGYWQCLAAFLIALVAGAISQVPGGLGVFESVMVLLVAPAVPPIELAAALLMFRAIYLVLPLFVAAGFVAVRSGAQPVTTVRSLLARRARAVGALAPHVFAGATFVAGAVLLVSGAVPAAAGRLAALERVVSLPFIEISHFVASLIGAALLLLARGLQRRVDAAWLSTMLLLVAGAILSLVKGWDFEEAIVVGIACAALLPFRGQFYRRSALFGEPFTPAWVAAIVIVLAAATWLLLFAHKHEVYAGESWWHFALYAEASRSVRATVGAIGVAALFALHRLIRPLRVAAPVPSASDIERARPIVARSPSTYANLIFRGDKAVLFSEAGDALLMYGRHGRSWIAMGDPVGPEDGVCELAWRYRDLCDRFDGWCVFFEVRAERRDLYAGLGLTLTQLGEEARVDLGRFTLETPAHKNLRQVRSRLLRANCRLEIVPQEAVRALLPALAGVSDAWLQRKATHEKGFSNASFDAEYLTQFPVAVVRRDDGIIAFANLWLGADKEELSVDLMRHLPDAPNGTMDLLFSELLLWGRAEGFRWFNFGMAPLSGLDAQRGAPLWKFFGTLVYRHGEHFYNFAGLRHYKAKFDPVWTPLYLASPGGLALPTILIDVAAVIAGGTMSIVSKRGVPLRTRS
jgi:phosphatidylglycerol lysyltransferase